MGKTIPEIMLEEHARLQAMLREFEELAGTEGAKEKFNVFKWNLDKHFFVEEKAVFHAYLSRTREDDFDIVRVIEEHNEMQSLVKALEEEIEEEKEVNLSALKEILARHEKFEDGTLYPRIEEELDEEQKERIKKRAEEIIKG